MRVEDLHTGRHRSLRGPRDLAVSVDFLLDLSSESEGSR